jgi:hypothetical protein
LEGSIYSRKTGSVKNYFVELEEDPSLMPLSVPYLKSLNV